MLNTVCLQRAVREMLSTGVRDPYTRFVPEDEFAALQKYDISGVGLNVGTAEDFVKNVVSRKITFRLEFFNTRHKCDCCVVEA